jgi:hypothetical protein
MERIIEQKIRVARNRYLCDGIIDFCKMGYCPTMFENEFDQEIVRHALRFGGISKGEKYVYMRIENNGDFYTRRVSMPIHKLFVRDSIYDII